MSSSRKKMTPMVIPAIWSDDKKVDGNAGTIGPGVGVAVLVVGDILGLDIILWDDPVIVFAPVPVDVVAPVVDETLLDVEFRLVCDVDEVEEEISVFDVLDDEVELVTVGGIIVVDGVTVAVVVVAGGRLAMMVVVVVIVITALGATVVVTKMVLVMVLVTSTGTTRVAVAATVTSTVVLLTVS
jgi:hypothetical protein